MSYDKPVITKLKIKQGDYTFIHDWFGENFQCLQTNQDYDLISVYCSPYGMMHLALQYGEHVEVLELVKVRQAIKEKINMQTYALFLKIDYPSKSTSKKSVQFLMKRVTKVA